MVQMGDKWSINSDLLDFFFNLLVSMLNMLVRTTKVDFFCRLGQVFQDTGDNGWLITVWKMACIQKLVIGNLCDWFSISYYFAINRVFLK